VNDNTNHNHLWYVRRGNVTKGPFPEGQISRDILLGRVRDTDELSRDREIWHPLPELPHLVPEVMRNVNTAEDREHLRLARLHEDERQRERRHSGPVDPAIAEQRHGDRRRPEPEEMAKHRELREHLLSAAAPVYATRIPLAIAAGIVLLFGATYFWHKFDVPPPVSRDCTAAPVPGVNWTNCLNEGATLARARLEGAILHSARLASANVERANLAGADLRYADLRGALLSNANAQNALATGTMLEGAVLDGADFTAADMRYVNLRGARLRGTILTGADVSRATWVDGRICADGSVGKCN
jgi:hypothetical protein